MSDLVTTPAMNKRVNQAVNKIETITFYKHHYVRKAGLKKVIKELMHEAILEALQNPIQHHINTIDGRKP
jgi:hypothetical protein